jgi:hypothetical protein
MGKAFRKDEKKKARRNLVGNLFERNPFGKK